jgi:hypothetical protein
MVQPEESDESTSPAMRRVFDELEGEFEAGLRREAEQEALAAVRAEVGATVLWEQLARRIGSETTVLAGARAFRGGVVASYPEFLVLLAVDGTEHLIRYGPAVSVALSAEPPALRLAPPAAARRYQFALALRELARRREPVRVELVDGARCDGTVERLAATTWRSPSTTLARRDAGQRSGPGGSWGSPPSSPSLILRGADEGMLARPVGRLLVHALDVGVELEAVHPPDASAAELHGRKLAATHQRVDLRDPHVEDRGHILQRVEPGLDAGRGHVGLLGVTPLQVAGRLQPPATAPP